MDYGDPVHPRIMEILYTLGYTLHYDFNGEKSGILVFGESRKEHLISSADRSFCCGFDKVAVGERDNCNHVGLNVAIFPENFQGISERISRVQMTFNALTAYGYSNCH